MDNDLNQFIHDIPKSELHIHIEGSLESELMFKIARRNKLTLPQKKSEELRMAYNFTNLQSFLDIYYEGTKVLQKEKDFYDLTISYLQRAHSQNVRHTEIFFDPQTHTERGIPFETVITGIHNALFDAEKNLGISTKLIMCFLRHLSSESAMETFKKALPFKKWIVGVGLDSSEVDNPPVKFMKVFDRAREEGFLTVAHAGEEGPPEYIWQALEKLKVSRIDHGVCCIEDPELVEKLKREQIPLTICPLANVKLGVFKTIEEHNLKKLLDLGLLVSVNSDDPPYFGGYVAENFLAVKEALNLDKNDIFKLAKNSFNSSFLKQVEKQKFIDELDNFMSKKIN